MFPPQRDTYIKVLPQHHRTTTQKKFDVRKYDNMSQHQKNFKAIQYIVQYWLKSAVKSDIILQSILKNSKVFEQKGDLLNFKANIDPMALLSRVKPGWAESSWVKGSLNKLSQDESEQS